MVAVRYALGVRLGGGGEGDGGGVGGGRGGGDGGKGEMTFWPQDEGGRADTNNDDK